MARSRKSWGHAKLTLVFDMMDIGNGVDRVEKAAKLIGDERYSSICQELKFASGSIDDIPDGDALRELLTRVELEASQSNSGEHVSIADARGYLLQAARKVAERTGKRLADVIAEASEGRLDERAMAKLPRSAGCKPRPLGIVLVRESSRHEVTWTWVRGHGTSAEQNRCDELAQAAARSLLVAA